MEGDVAGGGGGTYIEVGLVGPGSPVLGRVGDDRRPLAVRTSVHTGVRPETTPMRTSPLAVFAVTRPRDLVDDEVGPSRS